MRKLLNTLYVNNPECFLMLEDENVLVKIGEEVLLKMPLINLEGIITCGYRGATASLMFACAERGIMISFLTESGKYLGTFVGEIKGNITLRKEQYRLSDHPEKCCAVARNFIFGKLYNARWVLERAKRDYPLRVDVKRLQTACANIREISQKVLECEDLDRL